MAFAFSVLLLLVSGSPVTGQLDELLAAPVPVLPPLRKSESAAHPSVVSSACATSAAFITSSPLSAGSSSLSTSPLGGKAFGSSDSSSAAASRSARLAARMGSALEALHAELGAERHPRLRSALDDLEACRRELLHVGRHQVLAHLALPRLDGLLL